jgi:23S rRNA pseudouridine2605 synthase
LQVNRLIRVAYGPFQLGKQPRGAIQEVPASVLAEQLGHRNAARKIGRAKAKPRPVKPGWRKGRARAARPGGGPDAKKERRRADRRGPA